MPFPLLPDDTLYQSLQLGCTSGIPLRLYFLFDKDTRCRVADESFAWAKVVYAGLYVIDSTTVRHPVVRFRSTVLNTDKMLLVMNSERTRARS